MNSKRVFLDYAAATPIDDDVKKSLISSLDIFSNPSSPYKSGRDSKNLLDDARRECAKFLQCNYDEVIFTSGSTESNNLAIFGAANHKKHGQVISISTEHASVREPLEKLKREGFEVVYIDVDKNGLIDMDGLVSSLNGETILVTISYASSEIGTIQPISKISQAIKAFNAANNTRILFHTDASAASVVLPCDVSRLGVDLLTISGSKIYGPKGIGVLYVRRGTEIRPLNYGGSQENGLRAGTEPIELIAPMSKALELVLENKKRDASKFKELHNEFINLLNDKKIEYIYNGHKKDRLNNIVSIAFEGFNGEDLVAMLDADGYEVATGAACEANKEEPNRALLAIGLSREEAQGSLRISFGRGTQKPELRGLVLAIFDIINQ
jgi:cysteine desulfurase